MGERKYFGTDGIRGRVGEYPISADFMLRLGAAAGRVLVGEGRDHATVVIGKDTRISGYMFESALEAGLVAAGADVRMLGPMPTPAVAYLTRSLRADAGIEDVDPRGGEACRDGGHEELPRDARVARDDGGEPLARGAAGVSGASLAQDDSGRLGQGQREIGGEDAVGKPSYAVRAEQRHGARWRSD